MRSLSLLRIKRGLLCGVFLFAVATGIASVATAQPRRLSLDDLYDPSGRVNFSGATAPSITWIDAAHYVTSRRNGETVTWSSVDVQTGATTPVLESTRLEQALVNAGVAADLARPASQARSLMFNRASNRAMSQSGTPPPLALLLTLSNDLYLYALPSEQVIRLTSTPAAEEVASFSPDGMRVAFVRQGNLFTIDLSSRRETALTTDGNDEVLNGRLDWVYEEEVFGRGQPRAYWWSPDSTRLAYLRIDDRGVPVSTVVDHVPYEQNVERWRYPKVGDPNPPATLGVVPAMGGATDWIDVSKYPEADRIIAAVTWRPDARSVVFQVQNRVQTWLDLNEWRGASGVRTLLRETSPAWVADSADPIWLRDGSFLWLSERTGFKHIYHVGANGSVVKQVTDGRWEVRTLHGIDESSNWIFFSGTERSPIGSDVYRVRLAGGPLERLTRAEGTHVAEFSPQFDYFVDTWSDVSTPPQVRLHRSDGAEVRAIEPNHVEALAQFLFSKPEFLQVKTRDGFVMEAMMIKPPDFDPSRRYPVYTFVYGGPHSQRVRNAWATENLFHQLLAQQGIVVWECDNRTASGKGAESTWPVYRRFGELELRDIEDGLTWLKRQPYVDGSRIGIHGWSFGGYMTTYALTHSESFVMGIAGGTVSDWRDYDSVYTERYMGPLTENEEGYKKSSPRWSASSLHGSLLLLHGLIDDNVHVDNTIQLAYELQKAQKPFEMMLYPRSRHSVTDPALVKHLRTQMFEFVTRHLLAGGSPGQNSDARTR
jgi:dipeptidyl-peptidase 4